MTDYLLFAGHQYYPKGGALDFRCRGSMDDCKQWFAENWQVISDESYVDNWGQIVDPLTMDIVCTGMQKSGDDLNKPGQITWTSETVPGALR